MQAQELSYAVEALLFAQATPMDFAAIRAALRRALPEEAGGDGAEAGDFADAADAADGAGEVDEALAEGAADATADGKPQAAGDGEAAAATSVQKAETDGADAGPSSAPAAAEHAPAPAGGAPSHAVTPGDEAAAAATAEAGDADTKTHAEADEGDEDVDAAAFARSMSGASAFIAALDARQSTVAALARELSCEDDAETLDAPAAEAARQQGAGDAEVDSQAAAIDVLANDGSDAASPLTLTSPVIHAAKLPSLTSRLRRALVLLERRWQDAGPARGFGLVQVAGGYAFRTHPRFAGLLRGVREHKPQRLSRPALESLAIVAYRQPVTKPEVDHLRGVDSGGSLKVLLERRLVTVVGKKEEPGRPLLYGTTPDFLGFFNLRALTDLPSLREFHDLTDDDQEAVSALEGLPDLASLAQEAKNFRIDEAIATDELEEAIASLQRTQGATRAALLAQGVRLTEEDGGHAPQSPAAPTHH